jgi:aspartyl aminopeptidase
VRLLLRPVLLVLYVLMRRARHLRRACGSTVGPMLSKLGVRTVDVGCAMLSMHSIRETAGTHDVQHQIDFFGSFFEGFAQLDAQLTVD